MFDRARALWCVCTKVALVASVHVCRDAVSGRPLGYVYVNMDTAADPKGGETLLAGFVRALLSVLSDDFALQFRRLLVTVPKDVVAHWSNGVAAKHFD